MTSLEYQRDRPGFRLGNGYRCRACSSLAERRVRTIHIARWACSKLSCVNASSEPHGLYTIPAWVDETHTLWAMYLEKFLG